MNDGRVNNAIRNTKWGMIRILLNTLMPFVVRTFLIHTLSASYAGLSSLFTSILSVLSLAELGFSNAIGYSMYKPVAENDRKKICALLAVYRKAYRAIGLVILLTGSLAALFLPSLIQSDLPDAVNLYVLYFIYLMDLLIGYFLYGYQTCLLSVHQREDIVSRNALIAGFVLRAMQCVTLLLFRNYYVFVVLIPATTLLQNCLNHRSVRKLYPDLVPEGKISREEKNELKRNIAGLTIWKIGSATRNTFDSIVISMFLGLVPVAIYNNYMMIVGGVSSLLGVVSHSMLAGVGNKIATEDPETNYRDFRKFHFLYMWLAGWCTVCLACLFQPFMRLWMGRDMTVPDGIMFLFCYLFFMLKQGDINSVYYQAAGLWWQGKWRSVIEAGSNLILNLVLGKLLGLAGILLATIISYTIAYFYGSRFTFTCYFRNKGLSVFYLDNLRYLLVTAMTGFLTIQICRIAGSDVVSAVICLIFPNLVFLLIYGSNSTCRGWLKYACDRILKKGLANG